MKEFGIDISVWQGNYDLALAKKQGAKFVIIKMGGADDGYYKDSKFERNYKLAKELGLKVGAYFFSRSLDVKQAKAEAEYCVKLLKDKQFELPIYLDVENVKQLKIGKTKLTNVIKTWIADMEKAGYLPGVYSSASYFSTYMNLKEFSSYPTWIAQWSTSRPSGCGLWQFGGDTNPVRDKVVAGVTTDQNYLFIDYTSTIKEKGLNGFKKSTKTVKKTSNSNLDKKATKKTVSVGMEVLYLGCSGPQVKTLQRLLKQRNWKDNNGKVLAITGTFDKSTEEAVIKFQKAKLGGSDGIVGKLTWPALLN